MSDATQPQPEPQAEPPRDIHATMRGFDFDFLGEHAELAASHWRSANEAAFRGDYFAYGAHLRAARLIAFTVTQVFEKLANGGHS